jgi:hypothetical protein
MLNNILAGGLFVYALQYNNLLNHQHYKASNILASFKIETAHFAKA